MEFAPKKPNQEGRYLWRLPHAEKRGTYDQRVVLTLATDGNLLITTADGDAICTVRESLGGLWAVGWADDGEPKRLETPAQNATDLAGRSERRVMPRVDVNTIKPAKRGTSDFFSYQLYRWARAKPHAMQIWRGTWNPATGVDRNTPTLYIGHMDKAESGELWLHGRALRNLCLRGQTLNGYVYGPEHDTAAWEDITEQWWAEYARIGVCAIHGDFAHAWREDDDTRACRHCGKRQRRTTTLVEHSTWVDAA